MPPNTKVTRGFLPEEGIAKVLLHGAYGDYTQFVAPRRNYYSFALRESQSGLKTSWVCNAGNGTTEFRGWEFSKTGQGSLKPLLANRAALSAALGCHTLKSEFSHLGAYAFARAGFTPTQKSWDNVREIALMRIFDLEADGSINADTAQNAKDICADGNPEAIEQLAELNSPIPETKELTIAPTLGKGLLLWNPWEGELDLRNKAQLGKLARFLGKDTLGNAFENAKAIYKEAGLSHSTIPDGGFYFEARLLLI